MLAALTGPELRGLIMAVLRGPALSLVQAALSLVQAASSLVQALLRVLVLRR